MSIESTFDISLIAALALREKQIQQNYRPIIGVHKWFARRPGSLFRGLILSEFSDKPLAETYFQANDFSGRLIADPFIGGGTPLLEANRVGCDVIGFDINPMATWIVREEIAHIDLPAYRETADKLISTIERDVGDFYLTDCAIYGDKNVPVKYFLWVKVLDCEKCGTEIDLFPGYLLAQDRRHPKNVILCATCCQLNEVAALSRLGQCRNCRDPLILDGPAKRNRCACPKCRHINRFPRPSAGPLAHRLFAIEYINPRRRDKHAGRFFKTPDDKDLARVARASQEWSSIKPMFVPKQAIPPGDETDRLHRWGYRYYRELFNQRQLLGLELSCRGIAKINDDRLRRAFATNLSDLLRYQNMLCRYDTMALKSLDIFSVHGFPVGLVHCESNFLGILNTGGMPIGSGGWKNIIEKYIKAKQYADAPFETSQTNGRKVVIPIEGEWIGERLNGAQKRSVTIRCADSARTELEANSLDAVFTDPPYYGNVQYAELMDFCYVWLRRLIGANVDGFDNETTRKAEELTGNVTEARGLEYFTEGLAAVYRAMCRGLKAGAPLVFTFHHNRVEAYASIGVSLLDAGLVCSATLPCPAEMGGSIHIFGTGSSIIDTVFVCRVHGLVRRSDLFQTATELIQIVNRELQQLERAGMKPTAGDIRCIVYGHLTRMAIWHLRNSWDPTLPTAQRLELFHKAMLTTGEPQKIIGSFGALPKQGAPRVADSAAGYGFEEQSALSF
jgi:adenine-specific DNA methylase